MPPRLRLPRLPHLPRLRLPRREREPRVGEPVVSSAAHLERLVLRQGLAGLLAALLLVAVLDERSAAEVALALANMGVVIVTSWRFAAVGRWGTVLLAGICWTATSELRSLGLDWPPAVSWWDTTLRLGVLVTLAGGVSAFRTAIVRLLRTEDILAATVVRERDSARRDRLTRLWNSRYLHEALEQEIARCRRYGRPFGLLLIDLDGFKAVNDTAGHLAGDQVLQIVGGILRDHCRATDFPARLGGDEFAVILPEASREMVRAYAAKLVGLVAAAPFPADLPPVTASVGGIAFREAPASPKAAIAAADQAMYAAKRDGKNRAFVGAAP
jgi:diguanylate cyclase (GGDEF)-like protein